MKTAAARKQPCPIVGPPSQRKQPKQFESSRLVRVRVRGQG
jgi:hypothetical protein